MKLTTGILAVGMMTGGLWAQNPNIINNVQGTMNAVQQQKTNDSNAALGITNTPSTKPAAKPAPGAPARPGAVQPVAAAPVKSAAAPVKTATAPVKTAAAAPATPVAKPKAAAAAKPTATPHVETAAKRTAPKAAVKTVIAATKVSPDAKPADTGKVAEPPKAPKPEEKKWAMSGKRDPFFSPVVQQPSGSGCSTGKKCLEIGQINLRGVVKSENGFIAVVTNSLNKAYFLRENDPVFNGYVMRITGDAVVFQETVQDKLGKPLIREVTKRIFTPAV
jgi:Tfp pilus assembly protein PilP